MLKFIYEASALVMSRRTSVPPEEMR